MGLAEVNGVMKTLVGVDEAFVKHPLGNSLPVAAFAKTNFRQANRLRKRV